MIESQLTSRTQVRVRYGEVDRMGVVYHAHYLPFFEQGRTDWLRDRGQTYRGMEEAGYLLLVVEVGIRYHAPAHYDDVLVVTTRIAEQRAVRMRFEYEITRDGVPIASGHTVLACADKSGRPRRIPPWPSFERAGEDLASKSAAAAAAGGHS